MQVLPNVPPVVEYLFALLTSDYNETNRAGSIRSRKVIARLIAAIMAGTGMALSLVRVAAEIMAASEKAVETLRDVGMN